MSCYEVTGKYREAEAIGKFEKFSRVVSAIDKEAAKQQVRNDLEDEGWWWHIHVQFATRVHYFRCKED